MSDNKGMFKTVFLVALACRNQIWGAAAVRVYLRESLRLSRGPEP
jgi:hypothetical protein